MVRLGVKWLDYYSSLLQSSDTGGTSIDQPHGRLPSRIRQTNRSCPPHSQGTAIEDTT